MDSRSVSDRWEQGSPYEQYIGRWSRKLAPQFLDWLGRPAGLKWADVGCGTGALSAAILDRCAPASLFGIEPSAGFLELARQQLGPAARLMTGFAAALPLPDRACDVVASGLVLNFVPEPAAALAEMSRVTAAGGMIAAYVWDYDDGMEVIKRFWDAAVVLDPTAASLHEGVRFPLCRPAALREAFEQAGLLEVATGALDMSAGFADFDDYWKPFLGAQGPAPAYLASLSDEGRGALREALRVALPAAPDGSITLRARAWAVRGVVPGGA